MLSELKKPSPFQVRSRVEEAPPHSASPFVLAHRGATVTAPCLGGPLTRCIPKAASLRYRMRVGEVDSACGPNSGMFARLPMFYVETLSF